MMRQRALVTFTLGPLALWIIYQGGWWYFIPMTALLLIATVEYHNLTRRMGLQPVLWLMLPGVLAQLVAAQWPQWGIGGVAAFVTLVAFTLYAIWAYEKKASPLVSADWLSMIAGVVLLGWLGGHFLRLRLITPDDTLAWKWTALAMLTTWFADTWAYLIGKFVAGRFIFGRHRLSPRTSPNKTIEGYLAGILLGTPTTYLIGVLLFKLPLFPVLALGLLTSSLGTAGDLSMSLLKRDAGVKDSSNLFPGHGGALDRIDSLVWSAAIAYYLLLFVGVAA